MTFIESPELAVETALGQPAVGAVAAETRAAPADTVVAVVGLGYVGLPTAIALRSAGCRVVGIDTSQRRLAAIVNGEVELLPAQAAALRDQLGEPGFSLTDQASALKSSDVVLICVPTPVDEDLRPDPQILQRACAAVVAHARPGQTLVLTSTTYVGSTRELLVKPFQRRGLVVGEDVFVAFAPERIDPGVSRHDPRKTPRVVGGVSDECFRRASAALSHTCAHVHRVSSPEGAEMAKLYENTFRAVNIALAYEMTDACALYELDPIEVTEAAATKPYGFIGHYPSAGVGGHCIGVDPYYLVHPLRVRGCRAPIVERALERIAARPEEIVQSAVSLLRRFGRELGSSRVLVVGAAYKPGVADVREAPGVRIIARLLSEGPQVDYHDPLVDALRVEDRTLLSVVPDPQAYDLTILTTLHPGYDYDWLDHAPLVLDCTYRTRRGHRRFLP
jgi:UDP-N-acetyl-D-glucosamine dehydrogenase